MKEKDFNTQFKNFLRFIKSNFNLVIITILVVFFTVFCGSRFFSFENFITIARQAAILGMCGCGMMVLMLTGNVDMSLGGVMSFTSILYSELISSDYYNKDPIASIFVVLIANIIYGYIGGLIVTKTKMNSMIATLGLATMLNGFTYLLCQSKTIGALNSKLVWLGQGSVGPVPNPVIICGILMVILDFICKRTYLGRHMAATGSNAEAARLGGINTDRVKRIAFIIASICATIASIVLTYRVKSGQPNCGNSYQMNNLLACTVGGISYGFGGEGGVINVIYGIFIVGIITNGMTVMGLNQYWQYVMQGGILVFTVALDYLQRAKIKVD